MGTMQRGSLICITGLAGSGKTTLANELESQLIKLNKKVLHLTSDNVGEHLFSEKYLQMLNDISVDYSSEELKTIYNGLYMAFEQILKNSPETIIITDGMYRKASMRLMLRIIAAKLDLPFHLIKVETDVDSAKNRLGLRSKDGGIGGWVDPLEYEEPKDKDLIKISNNTSLDYFKNNTAFILHRIT